MRVSHSLPALILALHSFIPVSLAAQDFDFRQSIEVPPLQNPVTAGVELRPQEHSLLRPYWILDNSNTPVPIQTVDIQTDVLHTARILSGPDAASEGSSLTQVFDGNPETAFTPAATTEHRFLLQTEEPASPQFLLCQLRSGAIDSMRFRYGRSEDLLTQSFQGTPSGTRIPVFSSPATVFEIVLETSGTLEIAELQLLETTKVILFTAEPGQRYTLAYDFSASEEKPPTDTNLRFAGAVKAKLSTALYAGKQGADADGDFIPDAKDNCPRESNTGQKDADRDGIGDACDVAPALSNTRQPDTDGDGIHDGADNCPSFPNPDQKDIDGDGTGWMCDDADGDGVMNGTDNCIGVPNTGQQRTGGSALGDACKGDPDGDGIPTENDNCKEVPNADQADEDGDRVGDACDVCPLLYDPPQQDRDADGTGDRCQSGAGGQDADRDGIGNERDICVFTADPGQEDGDGDGVGDACDNCPQESNVLQQDTNTDGRGDACSDTDRDGVSDAMDNCPAHSNPEQEDSNGNGVGGLCEDTDRDRVLNTEDNCPSAENPMQEDADGDGIGDACDDRDNRTPEGKKPWAPFLFGGAIAVLAVIIEIHNKRVVDQQNVV